MRDDFDALIEKTMLAITAIDPVPDEILGGYVNVASLVRSISFHEGKLLEEAVIRIAQANPDLQILSKSIRLPIVPSALEALAGNNWTDLEGLVFDCDARTKTTYTPDLIVINKASRSAVVLDLKRSLASYGDTNRLLDLKSKMLASALVLPDWLYKMHKRLVVEQVGVAIIDGASRKSDEGQGIWALNDIDGLLEINGASAAMAELRRRFAKRAQAALRDATVEAYKLLDVGAAKRPVGRPKKMQDAGSSQDASDPAGNVVALPTRVSIGFAQPRTAK